MSHLCGMERPRPIMIQTKWKLPPREKVHEALSAVLDDRVEIVSAGQADVWSSDRSKRYTVTWSEDSSSFGANDNASFYQGYIGYPIIAVLLKLGRLPYSPDKCAALRDIPWKALNKKFKNNYAAAVDDVLRERIGEPEARTAVDQCVEEIFSRLKSLDLSRERPVGRPPS